MNKFAKRMANKQRKGFTLVELVVVILIIAILAAAIFLGGATVIRQARERQVQSDLKNFGTYVQDMMYENPELQYHDRYAQGEWFNYNPIEKTFAAKDNDDTDLEATIVNPSAIQDATTMTVLNLLQTEYLTDDFQLLDIVDAWDNPYCLSYTQVAADETGETSSCIIVINSLGNNSLDETSDGCGVPAQTLATIFATGMSADVDANGDELYDSAETFLAANETAWDAGDDYGVVIVMIDGQVSTGYYGF